MGSQVNMYICTDACAHSNQGIHHKQGDWDTHTHKHTLPHWGEADMVSQVDISTCTYFNQGVGPQVG